MTTKDENSDKEPKSDKGKMLVRLLISIVAFIALIKFGKVDVKEAFAELLTVNPLYFSLAILCYFMTLCVAGTRFFIASKALGFKKNLFQCIQLNYVGTFFNNFLPTTFGGDALRGYYLKSGSGISLTKAAACLLCERYAGMVVLFWMCSVAFLLRQIGVIDKTLWDVPVQMSYFAYAGSVGSVFIMPFLPKINDVLFGQNHWVYKKFIEPVLIYWHDLKLIGRIFLLSTALQSLVVLSHFFVAKSLGLEITLSYYLIFYPLTTIAGFLIPSLNGLGVREGAYIFFLSQVGINKDLGLAFSMGFLIILLITSVAGGIVYMFGDFRKNLHDIEDEIKAAELEETVA